MKTMTVEMLAELMTNDSGLRLIDVREHWEFELGHLAGSEHVPLGAIPQFIETAAPEDSYVFICHHGMRSARATGYARAQGFDNVFNLTGGVAAWSASIDANFPTY